MSDPTPDLILEVCQGCGREMDVTAFEPFSNVACPCGTETKIKRIFGNYRLERRYAVGGMSVVFVARDTTLDREVAVKILNEEYSVDGTRVEQFENEARLTAAVHNPHVVQIYTVGKAYGRFYLVMELLEGRSFELIMAERGALPETEVLEIARQVLMGLDAANQAGVIHRDVKPGNVLIDHKGLVKLVDFGLALITQGGKAQADEIWATPFYVPPEVLDKKQEDFRSDLYALGSTLYHALTGHPPFEAATTQTSFLREKKKSIPKLCKAASWLKPATCEAIDRMMTYDPKHRARSYGEALALVELALAESSDANTPIHGAARARRRGRKKKMIAFQAVAGVIALAGAAFVGKKMMTKEEPVAVVEPVTNSVPGVVIPKMDYSSSTQRKNEVLAEAWQEGRAAISQRDFRLAATHFSKISSDTSVPEPTRSWAEMEGVISRLLAGNPGKARGEARAMFRRLKNTPDLDATTDGLRKVAKHLAHERPIADSVFPPEPGNVVEWMSSLALILKNWEQGLINESRDRLLLFKKAEVHSDYEWFEVYRNLTTNYLHDAALLAHFRDHKDPSSAAEAKEQMDELTARLERLKTTGRAKFNIRARQAYLARLRKGLVGVFSESDPDQWQLLRESLLTHFQKCQFTKVPALLSAQPGVGSKNSRWAYEFLAQNAAAFIADLTDQKKRLIQSSKNGPEVEVISFEKDHLVVNGGEKRPWFEFDTGSLMRLHDEIRQKAPAEKHEEMMTHGIAYAWLTGFKAVAEVEAEKLAEKSPAFAKNWKRVMIGTAE